MRGPLLCCCSLVVKKETRKEGGNLMYPLQNWQVEELLECKANSPLALITDYLTIGLYHYVKTKKWADAQTLRKEES